jgi:quercetin dioxygenase-like cupin family protein
MRGLVGLTLAGIVATGAMIATAWAQEKTKEEYVPTADLKTLVQKPIPGIDGTQMTIFHVAAKPGWVGGKHYHSGPVYVYVLKGPFTIEEVGKGTITVEAGQVYEEAIGQPMQARNVSTTEPMELLVIQVSKEGEPLMYKVE